MKIKNLLLVSLAVFSFSLNIMAQAQQDTIAAWTFPSGSADSLIDISISANASRYLSCEYGTYGTPSHLVIPIDYTSNGSLGSPDKCAKVTGLENGADSIYFLFKFKTTDYNNIKLSCKMQAGGNNPGPRDFKAQYKLSGATTWIDINGGVITNANDWTTGVIDNVILPTDCENQSSNVSIRFIQTSNYDINGDTLLSTGLLKLDDIIILGDLISGINTYEKNNVNIYPNPSQGHFQIENTGNLSKISIFNILGKCIYTSNSKIDNSLTFDNFDEGVYFIHSTDKQNNTSTVKLVVE